jgi:ubiquinone/menaquinone biosynthesis C-methylase UbiE
MFYEQLTPEQRRFYYALELRPNMVEVLRERVPDITAFCGDCQRRLDFPDNYFDRILAIHVLEHLPNLPAAVREMHRLCKKDGGIFSVVIPCEGGLMYQIGRILSAKRIFERRYKQSYDWLITREHINSPAEVIQVLERYFEIIGKEYFPFFVPITTINLCIGLRLKPR